MPSDIRQAKAIVEKATFPGKIQAWIEYKDLFIFQVFSADPFEEEMDPFYSVNKITGEFREFPMLTADDAATIASLFMQAKSKVS